MNRITLDDPRDFLDYRLGSGGTVEIFDIAVGTERRQGKGRTLIERLVQEHIPRGCKLVWAITRVDNLIAHEFYEKVGFRRIAHLKNFYPEGDAFMYGKDV